MLHHYRCIRHIYPYPAGKHAGNITTQLYEQIQLGPTTFQYKASFVMFLNLPRSKANIQSDMSIRRKLSVVFDIGKPMKQKGHWVSVFCIFS